MNSDMERDDTYVAQLYQVFKSCDIYGTELLGEDELFNLCMRLQLDDKQTNYIISNLIGNDIIAKINFDDFKEIFVSLLTQSEANSEEQYSRLESNDVKSVSFNNNHKNNNSFNKNNDTNIEQYLRSIWERLRVGQNGYLNIDELYRVCEHIGMIGINSEVIGQLFDKLDYDQDGKVSFDEFLDGLFQYDSAICDNSTVDSNNSKVNLLQSLHSESPQMASAKDTNISDLTNCNHLNESDSPVLENNNDLVREHNSIFYTSSPYLITLDPDRNGYIEAENVIKLWESLGFTNSEQLLTSLGFNPKSKVNTQELSALLEEKLNAPNTSSPELFQVSLATFQNELTQTKINYEHIRDERDRLRINICEANTRADLLAQEVDDQNAKLEASSQTRLILLEKKYSEQIRGLQQELLHERESMDRQSLHLRQDIAKELSSAQEQSTQLRQKIDTLEQENKRLENEVQTMNRKHLELQRAYLDYHKRIDQTERLTKKLSELESMQVLVSEQHNEEIDSIKAQNKELQDRNDELVLQIENLKQELQQISFQRRNTRCKVQKKPTNHQRSQSWLSDYIQTVSVEELEDNSQCKSVAFNLKRRGNDSSSSDETEDDDCSPIGRSKRMVLSAKTHSDLDNALDEEYEESMIQNNGSLSEGTLLNQIDRLRHELSTQIGRTDQLIVDRNKTVLQIQQFYEKSLHNKEMEVKEQKEINSNLNTSLKECRERLSNETKSLKHCLHKHFNEVLNQFINSCIPSNVLMDEFEVNSFKQIRNSFSTLIFKHVIQTVLESDNYDIRPNTETQIQRLNEQLIEVFDRVSDELQVTHRNAYKRLNESHSQRDDDLTHDYSDIGLRQASTHEKTSTTNPMDDSIDILTAMSELRVRNSHLLKEIQLNEEQKRKIEKENSRLHYKCKVLSKLLSEISKGS